LTKHYLKDLPNPKPHQAVGYRYPNGTVVLGKINASILEQARQGKLTLIYKSSHIEQTDQNPPETSRPKTYGRESLSVKIKRLEKLLEQKEDEHD